MAEKMIFCKACGKEIAKSAKTCPNCGKRNKRPFWFTLLIIVGVIIVISMISKLIPDSGSSKRAPTASSKESTSTGKSGVEDTKKTSAGPIAITIDDPRDIPFLHNDPRIEAGKHYEITVDAWVNHLSGTNLYVNLKSGKYTTDAFRITVNSRIPDFEPGDPVRVVFSYKPTKSLLDQSGFNSELVSIKKR
jgi:RNA polymerase subunit RPABC4/transcription elongation factor Spt4